MMNRDRKIRSAMILCLVILLIAVGAAFSGIFRGAAGYSYENAKNYTAGDAEIPAQVKRLDIGWIDGKVILALADQNTVTLRETSKKNLSENLRLRWWLDGETLRVRYAAPGLRSFSDNLEKELTVTLPLSAQLLSADISTASGDITLPQMKIGALNISSTSGDVDVRAGTDTLQVHTTSGDQALTLSGRAESVELSATSGNVRLEVEEAGKITSGQTSGGVSVTASGKVGQLSLTSTSGVILTQLAASDTLNVTCTSGKVTVSAAEAGKVDITSTSGDVLVSTGKIRDLKVSTVSGEVSAALPEQPGVSARVHTVSGKVSTSLPASVSGEQYVWGDGSSRADISTVSGNVGITPWQE